jgi:hypothetical protein
MQRRPREKYESQCRTRKHCSKLPKLSTYFTPVYIVWEVVMPYHFNPLVSAVFASSLAAAPFLCLNSDTGRAEECVGKPDRSVNQAGHWEVDRVHHRRCWSFEPSKAGVGPAASVDRGPAQNTDSQQSWFPYFTPFVAKTFSKQPQQSSISSYSSEPPQNTVVENSIVVMTVRSDVVLRAGPGADFSAIGHVPGGTELETTDCIGGWCRAEFKGISGFVSAADRIAENRKLTSPKHLRSNKIASREQSQTRLPSATNGVAKTELHNRLPGNDEKNEKPDPQLTDTERRALFDDFLKWYRDGSAFGGRER